MKQEGHKARISHLSSICYIAYRNDKVTGLRDVD